MELKGAVVESDRCSPEKIKKLVWCHRTSFGLSKVVVKTADLRAALLSGGSPVTTAEMKK